MLSRHDPGFFLFFSWEKTIHHHLNGIPVRRSGVNGAGFCVALGLGNAHLGFFYYGGPWCSKRDLEMLPFAMLDSDSTSRRKQLQSSQK